MFGLIMLKKEGLEELGVLVGLISVQFAFALYGILMGYIMSIGISPLFLIIFGNFTTSFFFFPISVFFERKQWPRNLSLKLLGQLLLISFAGVTLFQMLMLYGVKKTSPALASVMPNLAPGFIFVIASVFRFEKIDMKCFYSRVKIIGTLGCIVGAILMSSMHSNASSSISHKAELNSTAVDQERIIGTFCLLAAVIVMSFNIILQAATLGNFPAPISLNSITSFLGAVFTVILQLITEHRLEFGSPLLNAGNLLGYALLGGIVCGACGSFQAWAMKKRGPVYVSTLSPIGTVFSVLLSALTLGDSVTFTSLVGMLLMFVGLYSVLWAKKKEELIVEDHEIPKVYETKKPLLS
ncbi:hypothetical protein AQUCO_01300747v1 [Aquilegia coerulea]|uniref:WAT1-related protein n=1 Tax=Aquilegia coerulea TaxID=218851 RepID=A0A2G5E3U8_AQUCA|nr:hypothetical protein AQUCO_01300747v1 [Aquilegia coerulea]